MLQLIALMFIDMKQTVKLNPKNLIKYQISILEKYR